MKARMERLATGAEEISETSNALVGYSEEVKASIEKIGEQIDLFKV